MHRINYFIAIICTGFLCLACTDEFNKNEQLQKAIQTVDSNPQESLRMLENMNLRSLDKDQLMHYVVTLTQARYMDYQDITGDTLILEAQRYFTEKHNPEMAARASFYAACFWDEKGTEEKGLEYCLLAHHFAQQAGNNLFMAKSMYWTGSTYYNQNILDSAKVYYRKALELYNNESNADLDKLNLLNLLGRSYFDSHQFDQALECFDNGLQTAQKLNNSKYEAIFKYSKGILFREKKEYPQAQEYFRQALEIKPDTEDSLRIYLSYARLFKETNQPDSVIYYLDQVKSRISEIDYSYTRRAVYQELGSYYKSEGNIHEMDHFLKLENSENLKIIESLNKEKILQATQKAEYAKQEVEKKYITTVKIGLTFVVALVFILIVFRFDRRKTTVKYQELRYQNLFQKMDWQNSLIGSLKGISQTADALCMNNQPITAESVRKELLPLRVKFSMEFADLTREGLVQFPNGNNASHKLSSEDLCIIHLKKLNHSDESISWMLGYEHYSKFYMDSRKREIRWIMTKAGMKENDIQTLFPW